MSKGKHQNRPGANKRLVIIIAAVAAVAVVMAVSISAIAKSLKGAQKPEENTPPAIVIPDPEPAPKPEPEPEPKPEPEPDPDPEPQPEPEPEPEPYNGPVNPLTGLPVKTDISNRRPIAVMINNIKVATPQVGISKLDIIYETLVEGGITRLLGISQDYAGIGVLGSVRSARPYFLDLAQGHDAIYIHAGGSEAAYTELYSRRIDHFDGVYSYGEIFFRDPERRASMGFAHSLMLKTNMVDDSAEEQRFRMEHDTSYVCNFLFTDDRLASSTKANKVVAKFSRSKDTVFEYNAENGLYYVSQYDDKMIDGATGEQLTVKNVIVIYATMTGIAGDDAGRLYARYTGTGKGFIIRDGFAAEITWSKDSATSQFVYTYSNGDPIELGRGVTYIAILSKANGNVSIQ